MVEKFEIKSHDGPGRLGKLGEIQTPAIFDEKEIKNILADDEQTAYNIEREIAEWGVRRTIEKAKNEKNENPNSRIAVIQGSKYVDLRIECGKKLEELGYNGLIIANGDDLLLHPRDLVNLIVELRKNLKPNTYLIFTFAECSFIPLLSYMGIDGFLSGSDEYYSYLNVLTTPTKNYDLEVYKLSEMNQKQITECNKKTLDFVTSEVREHMKNKALRNLIEERGVTSPQNASALRILDKYHQDYLQENTQLY
ncbi:putative tRNA-ribosyltransferase [Methanobrevibacter arboriphilus JCM 13429 = DSM 1125]|uniref:Putative tRNA-ribosyltransferase n=2 Tax=Methanobrevibacter arboriphilus TaxID=39441 RepID=A0A1V6N386_METAZ|nr:archaeosine tRNA-ribosyltransferase [Methanobrevibacter arboriphilus]OQD59135.1 putative tRNA-ribosyltransferase [Methanobrevibacter arboriphilus JCM 13429 = DSM 1125]